MKTNTPITILLVSSLFLICAICAACSDDDKPPPDSGAVDGGRDMAVDAEGDGPVSDGPVSDGPEGDTPAPSDTTAADLPPASPHKVVVTEFMANPAVVSDQDGEWLELYNAGTAAVDITGWTLKDDDKDSQVITAGDAGASLTIAPGQYVVLAKNGASASNGGVTAIYDYDDVFLANSSDEIVLLDESGQLVDRIVYGSGWKITAGASLQLKDPALDNADPSNWCTAATPWTGSAGDSGSPGASNVCAAAPDGGTDVGTDIGADADVDDSGTDADVDDSGTDVDVDDSGTDVDVDDSGTDVEVDDSGTDATSTD